MVEEGGLLMIAKQNRKVMVLTVALLTQSLTLPVWAGGFSRGINDALGPRYNVAPQRHAVPKHPPQHGVGPIAQLHHWNEIAINVSGLDHTAVRPGEQRVFGEQFGPGRASRAMSIVHIAIFEAVNAIAGDYQSYTGLPSVADSTSMDAAIAQAAHDTLVALFPSQKASCDAQLADDLSQIPDGRAKVKGIEMGQQAAAAILALRANDGSQHAEPRVGIEFLTGDEPGEWRQDPISLIPLALGPYWGHVTPTMRTGEQTEVGIYWAYDGTPSLCAPPRLYNQIAVQIADQMGSDVVELARLLALVNVAMADAGIAIWESKYYYEYWRPVTGIREADTGTGPTGKGDENPATFGDPIFSSLGAPASNLNGPNFTPPFPAYPSGHAGFGGALFQILRKFFRKDDIQFTFVSDEYNGVTKDADGMVRPLKPRSFNSLSEAEEENGQSRIYLGIHWAFDKSEGIFQGQQVADYVFDHTFTPLYASNRRLQANVRR